MFARVRGLRQVASKVLITVANLAGNVTRLKTRSSADSNIEKRALLVGIKYGNDLKEAHNDVRRAKEQLLKMGFERENITLMMDSEDPDMIDDSLWPSATNLREQLNHFVDHKQRNVQYVFWFAGHADQQPAPDGNLSEEDGKDEYILCCGEKGAEEVHGEKILDDELKKLLVDCLHPSSALLAICDSCHSGTLLGALVSLYPLCRSYYVFLDLLHRRCNAKNRVRRLIRGLRELAHPTAFCDGHPDVTSRLVRNATDLTISKLSRVSSAADIIKRCSGFCWRHLSRGPRVICISACKDSQSVPEVDGVKTMSRVIADKINQHPDNNPSLRQLRDDLNVNSDIMNRNLIKRGFGKHQCSRPQFSSLSPLYMDETLFTWKNNHAARIHIRS